MTVEEMIEFDVLKHNRFIIPKQNVMIHSLPEAGLYPEIREVKESLEARLDLASGPYYTICLNLGTADPDDPSYVHTLIGLHTTSDKNEAEKAYEQYLKSFNSGNYRIHLYPKTGVELLK